MRRVLNGAILALLILGGSLNPVSAGGNEYKRSDQKENGDVVLRVGRDGSLSQPAPRGGRLDCSLHEVLGELGGGSEIGISTGPTEQLNADWYYWLVCRNAAGEPVVERLFQYQPGVNIISTEDLAQEAVGELAVRYPGPQTSPAMSIDQLVGIDTWMWIDAATWVPIVASASIPGLSVTAVATPKYVTWDMGDGGVIRCDGPGTAYDDTRPEAEQSTDCSHLYQDRGAYTASATITYSVSWSASDGTSGQLADVNRTTQFPMTVIERQAVGR